MAKSNNKQLIINVLQEEGQPLNAKSITEKIHQNVSDRSLRRWLSELVNEGKIERIGQKRGTLYRLPSTQSELIFSKKVQKLLEKVRKPIHRRTPVSYNFDLIDAYQPNKSIYLPRHILKDLQDAGVRSINHEPAGTYARHIYSPTCHPILG